MKKIITKPHKTPLFTAEVTGQIEDIGPGKNRLLRKKNSQEQSGTYKELKILDLTTTESDQECDMDPYNKRPDLNA